LLFDEDLPHQPGCGVIWEWEVDATVEELLEISSTTVCWSTGATDDRYSCLIVNPFRFPLGQGFLDSVGVCKFVTLLFTTFFAFFLTF
jgi:hypothetical protein